jgi:hypothetical protein
LSFIGGNPGLWRRVLDGPAWIRRGEPALRSQGRPGRLLGSFAIALIAAGVSTCSSSDRAAALPPDPQLSALANRYFSPTTNMHFAGTPTSLWAAVLGISHGQRRFAARVFARGVDRSWSALPTPPGHVGAGVRFQIADNVGRPCLKYVDERARPRIPCWTGTTWRGLKLGGPFSRGLTPADLTSFRQRPTVLLYDRTKLRVVRWTGREWARLGSDFHVSVRRPQFGLGTDGSLTLGFDATRAKHRVRAAWLFQGARWRRVADVVLHGPGPSQSGPVIDHRTTLTAVVDARGADWPLYAVIASDHQQQNVAGGSLNEGPGAAQGSVGLAGGQAWAIWQQNAQRRDGLFDTRIVLRSIDLLHASAGPSRTLWTGLSNGPGDLQVLDALGTSWVAYMPAQQSGKREVAIEHLFE